MPVLDATWLYVWLAFAVLVGYYASSRKGHNGIVWFLLALVFSPLIVGIAALIMGPRVTASTQPPGSTFTPTLRVPPEGMASWARADPASPVTPLGGGVALEVIQRVDDWAEVRASNGWVGWVDGRRLVALAPPPPPPPSPSMDSPVT